jgi:hypothetical protein
VGPISITGTTQNVNSVKHNIGAAESAIVAEVLYKMFLYLGRIDYTAFLKKKKTGGN